MNILVDPIVLAVPDVAEGRKAFLQFVESVLSWEEVINGQQHDFFVSSSCFLPLYDTGRYPWEENLSERIKKLEIMECDYPTIRRVCQAVLENAPYFEDRVGTHDVGVKALNVNPDLVGRLPQELQYSLRESLAHAAYAKDVLREQLAAGLVLLSRAVPDTHNVEIDAIVEVGRNELRVVSEMPLVAQPDDVLRMAKLQDIWQDTQQALAWTVQEMLRCRRLQRPVRYQPFTIAQDFNKSILDSNYQARADDLCQIFWSLAELLTSHNPLRETNRNKPLRDVTTCRDRRNRRWEPWRKWVTQGKSGLRLHYWWLRGHFVVSRIAEHEDFSIGSVHVCDHIDLST